MTLLEADYSAVELRMLAHYMRGGRAELMQRWHERVVTMPRGSHKRNVMKACIHLMAYDASAARVRKYYQQKMRNEP